MKLHLTLITFLICGFVNAQTVTFHTQKLKATEGKLKAGQKDGVWRCWNYMGFPSKEENYKDGKLNGRTIVYKGDNPGVDASAGIDEMVKNKELYTLRLNRQKAFDQNEGEWKFLLKNNFYFIDRIICYNDNKIDSINVYENNRFVEQISYPFSDTSTYVKRTFRPYSYRDSVNQVIEEYTFKNNKRNGPYKKYNTKYQDEIMVTGYYLDGKRDSVWSWPVTRGGIKDIARYKNDKLNGLSEKWRYQSCIDSTMYLNGKKEGLCKSYRKSYSYKEKGKDTTFIYARYSNGRLNGTETTYKKGKITELATYVDGKREGLTYEYFDNGIKRSQGFYKNGRKDSLWQKWSDKNSLRSLTMYRNRDIIKQEDYYDEGKIRYSYVKKPDNSSIETSYYPDGKKRRETIKNSLKETITKWDEKGKKDVKVIDKVKYTENVDGDDSPPPVMVDYKRSKYTNDDSDDEDEDDDEETKDSKSFGKKYRKKKIMSERAEFPGGEKEQTRFLNALTKNDRREATGGFYVDAAVTISTNGEINFLQIQDNTGKVKKKYVKEAERIVLIMPRWDIAKKEGKGVSENTGFKVWFSEAK